MNIIRVLGIRRVMCHQRAWTRSDHLSHIESNYYVLESTGKDIIAYSWLHCNCFPTDLLVMNNARSSGVMLVETTRKATVNEIKIELSLTMHEIMGSHTTIIVYNPIQGPGYNYSYAPY